MKFGILQFFSWPARRVSLPTVYERALDRVRIMDKTGYDAVWLAEHHFTSYSVCPSVHMMGVRVADCTQNLRVGMGVSIAAFYHPLRLAEEVALLDNLSGGRVNWGAGRGFDPVEFKTFGIPVEESGRRFHEAVEIVLAAWTNQRLTWSGEFWNFEDVEVLPKPLQHPHPPVWLAAGSAGAVRWAGKRGYSIMLGPHSTFDENLEHRRIYAAELDANGHSLDARVLPIVRFIAVEDTDSAAEQTAQAGAEWLTAEYMNAEKVSKPGSADQAVLFMDREEKIRRYLDSVMIHGSPEKVVDQLLRLQQQMALEYLMCAPLSHKSFLQFTEKVMPRFL